MMVACVIDIGLESSRWLISTQHAGIHTFHGGLLLAFEVHSINDYFWARVSQLSRQMGSIGKTPLESAAA